MIRFISSLALLAACSYSLPAPRSPLVETPLEGQPPRPADMRASDVSPPRMPMVREQVLPGATLWLVEQGDNHLVTVRASTRRGNDGSYDDESMRALVLTLEEMLEDRLPGYPVKSFVDAHTLSVEVVVRSEDAPATLRALGAVLDEPIDGVVARRVLGVRRNALRAADLVRPHLFQTAAAPLVVGSAEALGLCRNERFSSADRLVTLIGDFNSGEMLAVAEETFADAHETPRIDRGGTVAVRPQSPSALHESSHFSIYFALAAPSPRHEHYDAFRLLLSMSEGTLQVTGPDHVGALPPGVASSVDEDQAGSVALLAVRDAAANARPLFESFSRHAQELSTQAFSLEALELRRAQHWARVQTGIDRNPGHVLAGAFARHLSPAELEARYRSLGSVTPESLQELQRQYFAPESMIVLVRGPRDPVERFQIERSPDGFLLRIAPPRED